jgi:hypothetical protein
MRESQHKIISILLLLSFFPIGSALAMSKEDEAARESALHWLQDVDLGNYKDARLQIAQEVRDKRDWQSYLAADRARLGRVVKRRLAEIKHSSTTREIVGVRDYAIARFKTYFEHAAAIEQVTLAKMGCCWEVCGYEIAQVRH